jgi:hypothetical protein
LDSDTHWLNQKRLTVYPRLAVVILFAAGIIWVLLAKQMVDLKGKPLGYDFITFWSASYVGLAGHAADAYNIPLLFKAENIAVPASRSIFAWYYPPSFYLLILPLALLPYMAAYVVFILSTLVCFLLVFRRIVSNSTAMWCLAGFSGLWMNLFQGQNGFLTATLAGAALLCMAQRPTLAGIFIGLLAIKPHLALLFPVALVAIGAWRTIISAAVSAITFTAAGTAVLGTRTLKACLASLGNAHVFLEKGVLPWPKMPSVFAFLRLLGVPVIGAYLVHTIVAVGAGFSVWHVWRRSSDWQLRGATLMTATFLVSPYLFDYDLVWLAFPIVWLSLIGLRKGWLQGEREVLVAAWILPLLMAPLATAFSVQIGPLVLGALLWVMIRRAGTVRTYATSVNDYALEF